jgi:hypothetical protein
MDEIEAGFEKILQKIKDLQEKDGVLSEKIRNNDAKLLRKMAETSRPIVKSVGLNMLKMGKQDTKGEIYDPAYYPAKMIVLGKTEPAAFRPDNPSKTITDQFCILSEDGDFFELMYSFDGFLTDSYLNPIDTTKVIGTYGYDIIFMLYQAMHDYLKGEEALIDSLEKVIGYVF